MYDKVQLLLLPSSTSAFQWRGEHIAYFESAWLCPAHFESGWLGLTQSGSVSAQVKAAVFSSQDGKGMAYKQIGVV
jgi:hypothetical protein